MCIQSCADLSGTSECWRLETPAKIVFLVSPAVKYLLENEDEEIVDQIMKDLVVIDIERIVDDEFRKQR